MISTCKWSRVCRAINNIHQTRGNLDKNLCTISHLWLHYSSFHTCGWARSTRNYVINTVMRPVTWPRYHCKANRLRCHYNCVSRRLFTKLTSVAVRKRRPNGLVLSQSFSRKNIISWGNLSTNINYNNSCNYY